MAEGVSLIGNLGVNHNLTVSKNYHRTRTALCS